SVNVVDRRCR
ncbi:hypothetical protein D043_5114B, partial [Vibrio parahaemolyticus EKP-021]